MRVIVGSSDLALSLDVISEVASSFATADAEEAYGIRVPFDETEPASPVERLVERVADRLGRSVVRFSPTKGGRAAVFHRDYDLVTGATEVLAFFATEREMEGGTGHVVKAALDRGVKVDAYGVRPDGTLVFLGSDDTDATRQLNSTNDVLQRMFREAQEA